MAVKEFSFDIVSKADAQEVRNAVDQAQRELANRYDFKGSKTEIEQDKDGITLIADDEFKLSQLKDILISKFVKRNVDIRFLDYGKIEPATGLTVRQRVTVKSGIPQDAAKALSKQIRDKAFKAHAQIQGDAVRVTSKDKDELQKVITFVKGLDLGYPVSFENYR